MEKQHEQERHDEFENYIVWAQEDEVYDGGTVGEMRPRTLCQSRATVL